MFKAVWVWNLQTKPIEAVIEQAQAMQANALIVKAGYHQPAYSNNFFRRADFPHNAKKVRDAGLSLFAEVFNMPGTWQQEADCLRWTVLDHGATSVVLNVETPYETTDGRTLTLLAQRFNLPTPVWASTDFRGNRLAAPYHKRLSDFVTGWMPMIYPRAFYPDSPFGDIQRAFDGTYHRWNALRGGLAEPGRNAHIFPTIQTYGQLDYEEVLGQIVLAHRWAVGLGQKFNGTSLYASHDINSRAQWGAHDGWLLVEQATAAQRPPQRISAGEVTDLAARVSAAATSTVRRFFGS